MSLIDATKTFLFREIFIAEDILFFNDTKKRFETESIFVDIQAIFIVGREITCYLVLLCLCRIGNVS